MSGHEAMYSDEQRGALIQLARQAVTDTLSGRSTVIPEQTDVNAFLFEPRGCFVTLNDREHRLRGCIGCFEPRGPLAQMIIEMGKAATRDPRFVPNPVTLVELPYLLIEVSVLSPLQKIDDPMTVRAGIDGIYIIEGNTQRSGCFLPQVATDQGWGTETFISNCCSHKMGLPADAWKTMPSLEFYVFQAEVFGESAPR